MSNVISQVLAIADNARIDHEAGHPRTAAPFSSASHRAAVRRGAARGLLRVTESSRAEMWAEITADGRAELARLRGQ